MDWRPVCTADGSWTLEHPVHGQACHSHSGAWLESRERYAGACRLRERAAALGSVRLLDVGTGLGLNIAAALEALDGSGASLVVLALERDRDILGHACEYGALGPTPPELERWHAPVRRALRAALAECATPAPFDPADPSGVGGPGGELALVVDDARVALAARPHAEQFDAVFLDPFSPRIEGELWEPAFLREVARRMAPGSVLSTYTVALDVRAALAEAGLTLGSGPTVGDKLAGTVGVPRGEEPPEPLDERSALRLARRLGGE